MPKSKQISRWRVDRWLRNLKSHNALPRPPEPGLTHGDTGAMK